MESGASAYVLGASVRALLDRAFIHSHRRHRGPDLA